MSAVFERSGASFKELGIRNLEFRIDDENLAVFLDFIKNIE